MIVLNFKGEIFAAEELSAGIKELAFDYGYQPVFCDNDSLFTITAEHGAQRKLSVRCTGNSAVIVIDKKIHFFRALGLLLGKLHAGAREFEINEDVQFDMNGPMFDVSQGSGVINLVTLRRFIRNMALLGLNMLMLYCEDSFDVEGEPYFGYMRSRYSEEDMRTLDDYAYMFGIEMIPCIQTLAHLHEVLKWKGIYNNITDYHDCLLVGEEKTYEFIRRVIASAIKPFRTKRIHIGMDEAWQLGQGQYLIRNGWKTRDEIMKEHLSKVIEIVREFGLKPMMWGDMFLNNPKTNSYYDCREITQEAIDNFPKDMTLIYWDYYHNDSEDFYLDYIDKHSLFCTPIFAGGIWTWDGFGANWGRTFNSTTHALSACKKKGIREVFVTIWGDCDTECNVNITLPGLVLYAEHGYSACAPTEETLRERFEFVCKGNYDDFMAFQNLDHIGEWEDIKDSTLTVTPSKCLLWQDVLLGLFDKNIEGVPFDEHFAKMASRFAEARERGGIFESVMDFNYHVCHTLALKATMGLRLTNAYRSGDKKRLEELMKKELPELKKRVTELRDSHRAAWLKTYKPLGWATFDGRYGGVLGRIDTAICEIGMYLNGELDSIAELEEERLYYNGNHSSHIYCINYGKIAYASRLF